MPNTLKFKPGRTIQVDNKNPVTWHQGIKQYGFWAIVINNDTWLDTFKKAQAYVKHLVLSDYQRAPHITLSACGLVNDSYFSERKLQQQIDTLHELNLSKFLLNAGKLDSFESAPYISIKPHPKLARLRRLFESIHQDNPAADYYPHLTLGFYNKQYPFEPLHDYLGKYKPSTFPPLLVDTISYCTYQTNQIQGCITTQYEHQL